METIYRAFDGTEFATAEGCKTHEHRMRNPMSLLACTQPQMLTEHDVHKVDIKDDILTIQFEDLSIIEITHTDVRAYPQEATRCVYAYKRDKASEDDR